MDITTSLQYFKCAALSRRDAWGEVDCPFPGANINSNETKMTWKNNPLSKNQHKVVAKCLININVCK